MFALPLRKLFLLRRESDELIILIEPPVNKLIKITRRLLQSVMLSYLLHSAKEQN